MYNTKSSKYYDNMTCIQMDFSINVLILPIVYFKGHRYHFLNYDVFLFLKVVLILENSANSDEMQHNAAFHLGLHCLPKYPFGSFPYTKG